MAQAKNAAAGAAQDLQHIKDGTPPSQQQQQPGAKPPCGRRVAEVVAHHLSYLLFAPLIVMIFLGDSQLLLAAVLCAVVAISVVLASLAFRRAGILRVWPKSMECFNAALFVCLVPIAAVAGAWLKVWLGLLTTGCTAVFMWATILLPRCEPFIMPYVRDKTPTDEVARLPLLQRLGLALSLVWAAALAVMTLGALIPLAMHIDQRDRLNPVRIICGGVLQLAPLIAAAIATAVLAAHFKRRIRAAYQQGDVEQPQPQPQQPQQPQQPVG